MIDIRSVESIFLANKRKPFIISLFITYKSVENIRDLMHMKNLFVLFVPRYFKNFTVSPLASVKAIELISCAKGVTVIDVKTDLSLYQWLNKYLFFSMGEVTVFSPLEECMEILSERIEHYVKRGWLRTSYFPCKSILVAQEKNECIQELKEVVMGYLYLTK